MTTREIRLKAAEILEASEDAWCQGAARQELSEGKYAYCLVGACQEAAGYFANWYNVAAYSIARDARAAAIEAAGTTNASGWNDAPGRTREQVIAALRAV